MMAAFLFWSAAGLIFTVGHISQATVAGWRPSPGLAGFVDLCLQCGDPILIVLAFANTHLHAARQWTPAIARRWGLLVLVFALALETSGARIGFPFGHYHYNNSFGWLIGVVPMTIPLAWHVVVTNALFIVRAMGPYLSRSIEALLVAALCTLYDVVLEPFATTIKHYWTWDAGSVPMLNYISWFVISALLVRIFAPTVMSRARLDPRPWLILGATLLIFLAGRI